MIGRPMSVNSSFDSHGSHNPNFPRDSSFDSRYLPSLFIVQNMWLQKNKWEKKKVFQKYYSKHSRAMFWSDNSSFSHHLVQKVWTRHGLLQRQERWEGRVQRRERLPQWPQLQGSRPQLQAGQHQVRLHQRPRVKEWIRTSWWVNLELNMWWWVAWCVLVGDIIYSPCWIVWSQCENNYFLRPECWNNVEKYRWCSSTGNGWVFISLSPTITVTIPGLYWEYAK